MLYSSAVDRRILVLLWTLCGAFLIWWAGANPLPDGFQNEYLHMGNAFDLWGALAAGDWWHVRWFLYTGYWPAGFQQIPWPFMAILGPTRLALLLGNLVHLGVLLWAVDRLGRAMAAPLAPLLVVLCPAVFGTLVRFEPNLANIAWVAAGVAFLVDSQGLRRRRAVVGWGVCLGIGLMMDRLSVGFFLLPAVVPLLLRAGRAQWKNLAWGGAATLLLAGAYYREFFLRHTGELLSQAPVGEIDSAGALTAVEGPLAALYYPLALLDSQAGLAIGALMLVGLVTALLRAWPRKGADLEDGLLGTEGIILAATVVPLLFFTLVAKNQVFYTLPIIGPLAVLAARHRRLVWLALAGGLWVLLGRGLGVVSPGPWLPEAWVAPRHTLARSPSGQVWPLDEAFEPFVGTEDTVAIFSSDHTLYEGFVVLAAREACPSCTVRPVILDPVGTHERAAEMDWMISIGPAGQGWPTPPQIKEQLRDDHYDLDALPAVWDRLAHERPGFQRAHSLGAGDVDIAIFRRQPAPAQSPLDD